MLERLRQRICPEPLPMPKETIELELATKGFLAGRYNLDEYGQLIDMIMSGHTYESATTTLALGDNPSETTLRMAGH